jgi:zinc transport system permease protein
MLAIVTLLLALLFTFFLHPIVSVAFDKEFARSQGIPVTFFEYLLMFCIALTIVSCLRMVGIVLAISLLTIPQMTANLFTFNFKKMIGLSILIGFLSCVGGLALSYWLNVPSGATIIFFSILIYVCCKIVKTYVRIKR